MGSGFWSQLSVLLVEAHEEVFNSINFCTQISVTLHRSYGFLLHEPVCSLPRANAAKALGLNMNIKTVNLFEGEQTKPEFVAINPQGFVPVLVDGDLRLWERWVFEEQFMVTFDTYLLILSWLLRVSCVLQDQWNITDIDTSRFEVTDSIIRVVRLLVSMCW